MSDRHTRTRPISGTLHVILFSVVQAIVFGDRAIVGGAASVIQKNFNVDDFEVGLLGSIFMLSFVLMSIVLTLFVRGKSVPLAVIFGLMIWIIAMVMCGLATKNYFLLLIGRALSGAGEAAYCSFAPPMIDDTAPPERKTTYLSVYYMSVFVGAGSGFLGQGLFSTWENERYLFIGEACAMLPLVIFLFVLKDRLHIIGDVLANEKDNALLRNEFSTDGIACEAVKVSNNLSGGETQSDRKGWNELSQVLCNGQYVLIVLGYAAYMFTLGGMLFWSPKYVVKYIHISRAETGLLLGALVLLTGIGGNLLGGVLLDKLVGHSQGKNKRGDRLHRSIMAIRVSLVAMSLAMLCMVGQLFVFSIVPYFLLLFLSMYLIFATQTCIIVSMMEVTEESLRPLALGLSILVSHALGDLLSPALIGYVEGCTGSLWQGMCVLCLWPFWSILFWGLASCGHGLGRRQIEDVLRGQEYSSLALRRHCIVAMRVV